MGRIQLKMDWARLTRRGLIGFPESPRQLVEQDREEEAMSTLRKLHYDGTNDAWINAEFGEIRNTILAEKAITAPGWGIMFTVPAWRERLLHGVAVQAFTQLTGISTYIFTYLPNYGPTCVPCNICVGLNRGGDISARMVRSGPEVRWIDRARLTRHAAR